MCAGVVLFGSNLFETLYFLDLYVYILCQIRGIFLCFQISFQYLALPLLLLAPLWFGCWYVLRCSRVFLFSPHFFEFFFLHSVLIDYFFLMFQTVDLNPSFFPSLLVPCGFFFFLFFVCVCINYILTDKTYKFISSWTHPQCDPDGLWSWCAGLEHEDPRSGAALSGPKFSLAAPGLHEACCLDHSSGTSCIFRPLHPSVCSRTSLESCPGVGSA